MMTYRQKVANIFDEDNKSLLSKIINLVIITAIIVTVIAIILESLPSLHPEYTHFFETIERVSVTIFLIEYILRVWSAPDNKIFSSFSDHKARIKHIFTFHAIIDLLAILPFIFSLFAVDLRFLRAIRLLRIFKLTRYNSSMNTLVTVVRKEMKALSSVVFMLLIVLIISASCIYLFEHKAQPETFGSIPQSMWWAMVTLSTIGYGDAVPITSLGKLFGAIIMLLGVGLVALPAGLLASAFSEQFHKNKKDYEKAVDIALSDGILTPDEYEYLAVLQEKYDLSEEEATEIVRTQMETNKNLETVEKTQHACPNCGYTKVD